MSLAKSRVKMGWYKVPHYAFDYASASVNPTLPDMGRKERENPSILLSHLLRYTRDARTMSLMSSFLDMSRASAGRILREAMTNQDLPDEARDLFQCLIDI